MYGKTSNLDREITPFPVSESVDNVKLSNIEYFTGMSKSGNNYQCINVKFVREIGNTLQILEHKIYPVDTEYFKNDQEGLEKEFINFNAFAKHIATKFGIDPVEMEKETFSTTFQEFAMKYSALVTKANTGQLMYIKTLKNKSGYPILPRFPKFLQPMDSGESTLAYTTWEQGELRRLDLEQPKGDSVLEVVGDTSTALEDIL